MVRLQPKPHFITTRSVQIAEQHAELVLRGINPALITGKAGVGKTETLLYLKSKYPASAYLKVTPADKSPLGMIKLVHRQMGYWEQARHHQDVRAAVLAALKDKNGSLANWRGVEPGSQFRFLLLVDEAQNLEPKALKDLLDIAIDSGTALVMAGNLETESLASGKPSGDVLSLYERSQIATRIGCRMTMFPLGLDDMLKIAAKPEFSLDDMDAHKAAARYGEKTSVREMITLLQQAKLLAGDQTTVTINHLREAVIFSKNDPKAIKLLENRAA
ncbi:MAG: ATP-binding protein [Nitratireductor sp.]